MKLVLIMLIMAVAGTHDADADGELSAGVRLDGYTDFQNFASGLMGLDLQYTGGFPFFAPPQGGEMELRWGVRMGLLFDGLYNVESKVLQPRFFPVYVPMQPVAMVDFHLTDALSLRLGTADGITLILYPEGVVSLNFNFHVFSGAAYRFKEHWGMVMEIGWGFLGKWSYWNGPQFSLGTFFSVP
jgi:hypothetical protein